MIVTDKTKDAPEAKPGERVVEVSDGERTTHIKLRCTARVDSDQIAMSITPVLLDEQGQPLDEPIQPGQHTFMLGQNASADPALALQQAVEAEAKRAHTIARQLEAWRQLGVPALPEASQQDLEGALPLSDEGTAE